jgi:hypothetical protein
MVFGLAAIVLGIRQVRLGEHRSERFIRVALLLGGAFTRYKYGVTISNKLHRRTWPGAFRITRALPRSTHQRTWRKQERGRISAGSYAL